MSALLEPSATAELAEIVRDHAARRATLAVRGAGSWPLPFERVPTATTQVSTRAMRGIVEYVPGDLTLTARAGTTLAEIDAATAPHGQWCPLLPWGSDEGTLGATFATATTGPCRRALGAPRDLALGLEFVDGTGARIRGGGRVVKNVAGFDLTRLLVGAWGTLGIITEISVRLRSRPVVDTTLALRCELDGGSEARIDHWTRGPYAPLACERLSPAHAAALGLGSANFLVRLGGNQTFVAESMRRCASLGSVTEVVVDVWSRYRALDPRPRRFESAFASPLAARVRAQFDPHAILNPGLLGEVAA